MLRDAMVQSQDSPSWRHSNSICTDSLPIYFLYGPLDVWNQLGESKYTDGHVAEEIVIVLVLDGAQDGDCVPDTRHST